MGARKLQLDRSAVNFNDPLAMALRICDRKVKGHDPPPKRRHRYLQHHINEAGIGSIQSTLSFVSLI